MTTSKAIWVVAILMFIFAAYCVIVGINREDWTAFVWSFISVIGGAGIIFKAKWSQYLVYLLSFGIVATWAYAVWSVSGGDWPYPSKLETIVSLIPGVVLVIFCVAACFAVHLFFRALPSKQ